MLYCFEITILNGKRTRYPFSALIKDTEELFKLQSEQSLIYGYDVQFTTVKVKDADDLQRWIDIYQRNID